MVLTLASNGRSVYVNVANIAFVEEIEGKDPRTKKTEVFSRIRMIGYAKFSDNDAPFIDVKETIKQISDKMSRAKRSES